MTENLGVFRLRRRVFNGQSTAGAMATTRLGGRHDNVAYELDSRIRTVANEYLTLHGDRASGKDYNLTASTPA